jgi:glycerol uptake facilitator protein
VDNLGVLFLAELVGTAMLVLLGCGVVANVALTKTKGFGGGFLLVNFGWGFAVFAGVIVAYASGAHINPAVTLGLVANGATEFGNAALGTTVEVGPLSVLTYIGAQLIGAILGAVLCWSATSSTSTTSPSPRRSWACSRRVRRSARTAGTS